MPSSFGAKLEKAFAKYGQLCVGIDPHASLLEDWGLADSADGLRDFSMRALDASVGRVGVIKPQVSFFERFGSAGFAVLEELGGDVDQTGPPAGDLMPAAPGRLGRRDLAVDDRPVPGH